MLELGNSNTLESDTSETENRGYHPALQAGRFVEWIAAAQHEACSSSAHAAWSTSTATARVGGGDVTPSHRILVIENTISYNKVEPICGCD